MEPRDTMLAGQKRLHSLIEQSQPKKKIKDFDASDSSVSERIDLDADLDKLDILQRERYLKHQPSLRHYYEACVLYDSLEDRDPMNYYNSQLLLYGCNKSTLSKYACGLMLFFGSQKLFGIKWKALVKKCQAFFDLLQEDEIKAVQNWQRNMITCIKNDDDYEKAYLIGQNAAHQKVASSGPHSATKASTASQNTKVPTTENIDSSQLPYFLLSNPEYMDENIRQLFSIAAKQLLSTKVMQQEAKKIINLKGQDQTFSSMMEVKEFIESFPIKNLRLKLAMYLQSKSPNLQGQWSSILQSYLTSETVKENYLDQNELNDLCDILNTGFVGTQSALILLQLAKNSPKFDLTKTFQPHLNETNVVKRVLEILMIDPKFHEQILQYKTVFISTGFFKFYKDQPVLTSELIDAISKFTPLTQSNLNELVKLLRDPRFNTYLKNLGQANQFSVVQNVWQRLLNLTPQKCDEMIEKLTGNPNEHLFVLEQDYLGEETSKGILDNYRTSLRTRVLSEGLEPSLMDPLNQSEIECYNKAKSKMNGVIYEPWQAHLTIRLLNLLYSRAIPKQEIILVQIAPGHGKSIIIQALANIVLAEKKDLKVVIVSSNDFLSSSFAFRYKDHSQARINYVGVRSLAQLKPRDDTILIIDEADEVLGPAGCVLQRYTKKVCLVDATTQIRKWKAAVCLTGSLTPSARARLKQQRILIELGSFRKNDNQITKVYAQPDPTDDYFYVEPCDKIVGLLKKAVDGADKKFQNFIVTLPHYTVVDVFKNPILNTYIQSKFPNHIFARFPELQDADQKEVDQLLRRIQTKNFFLLISPSSCRGIDFKGNGNAYVVIMHQPTSWQEIQQTLGRGARTTGKGTEGCYCYFKDEKPDDIQEQMEKYDMQAADNFEYYCKIVEAMHRKNVEWKVGDPNVDFLDELFKSERTKFIAEFKILERKSNPSDLHVLLKFTNMLYNQEKLYDNDFFGKLRAIFNLQAVEQYSEIPMETYGSEVEEEKTATAKVAQSSQKGQKSSQPTKQTQQSRTDSEEDEDDGDYEDDGDDDDDSSSESVAVVKQIKKLNVATPTKNKRNLKQARKSNQKALKSSDKKQTAEAKNKPRGSKNSKGSNDSGKKKK